MTLAYLFTKNGGFIAGDTKRRRASFAYPTSDYAAQASRSPTLAAATARKMIEADTARPVIEGPVGQYIREREEDWLAMLATGGTAIE